MKILILDNFFNQYHINFSRIIDKFLPYYKKIKLKSLIKKILKKNNENIEVKIITNSNKRFYINSEIEVELLSDFRIKINRTEFLKIKKKVIEKTKTNLIKFLNNLKNLKTFHINGIFIGKLLEFELMRFFNEIFGEFELLKKILQTENYNKVILFNFNPDFLSYFRGLNVKFKNIEAYRDPILKKIIKMPKWLIILGESINFLGTSIKNYLLKESHKFNFKDQDKINIIFMTKLKNFYESINPIYKYFKNDKNFNPIYYRNKNLIHLKKINSLIKFLFQIKRIWLTNQDKILLKMEYDSLKLNCVIKEYYDCKLFYSIINFFNILYSFNQFIKHNLPSIVITTQILPGDARLLTKNCFIKGIPTIYVPHAAIPFFEEITSKTEISYLAVSGECDKDYLVNKGEPINKIIVTGRPRYEHFYNGKMKQLFEVRDMFNSKKYKFKQDKFTILLTTNPVDVKSTEKLITLVVHCLKELSLIDNLIIKLHPLEDGIIHKKILQQLNVKSIIVKDYNIFELIKSCNLLLSRTSTVILETMIIGTPIILLDFVNFNFISTFKYIFLEEESLITVRDRKTLTKKIKELSENKVFYTKYSETLKEIAKGYSFLDKKESPTEKIVNLIFKIIKNNRKNS